CSQRYCLHRDLHSFPTRRSSDLITLTYGIANMGVSPKELEAAMEVDYDLVKQELISENEFQKLKNQIETAFVNNNASVAGVAESLANYHLYFGDANLINTEIERY